MSCDHHVYDETVITIPETQTKLEHELPTISRQTHTYLNILYICVISSSTNIRICIQLIYCAVRAFFCVNKFPCGHFYVLVFSIRLIFRVRLFRLSNGSTYWFVRFLQRSNCKAKRTDSINRKKFLTTHFEKEILLVLKLMVLV